MLIDPQGNIAFLEEHDTQGPDRRPHKIIRSPTNATTKYMNEYDRPHAVKLPSIAVLLCLSPRAAYRIATGWRSSGIAFKLTHQTTGPGDLIAFSALRCCNADLCHRLQCKHSCSGTGASIRLHHVMFHEWLSDIDDFSADVVSCGRLLAVQLVCFHTENLIDTGFRYCIYCGINF